MLEPEPVKVAPAKVPEPVKAEPVKTHMSSLFKVYGQIYDDGVGDVAVLLADGTTRKAFSRLLTRGSEVFSRMFSSGWCETTTKSLDLSHHPTELIDAILRYLHCMDVPQPTKYSREEQCQMVSLCDLYGIDDLKAQLTTQLVNLSPNLTIGEQRRLLDLCRGIPATETLLRDKIMSEALARREGKDGKDRFDEYYREFRDDPVLGPKILSAYTDVLVVNFRSHMDDRLQPATCYDRVFSADSLRNRIVPEHTCCTHYKTHRDSRLRGPTGDTSLVSGGQRGEPLRKRYFCIAWMMDSFPLDKIKTKDPGCITEYCCYHRSVIPVDNEGETACERFLGLDPEIRTAVTRALFKLPIRPPTAGTAPGIAPGTAPGTAPATAPATAPTTAPSKCSSSSTP